MSELPVKGRQRGFERGDGRRAECAAMLGPVIAALVYDGPDPRLLEGCTAVSAEGPREIPRGNRQARRALASSKRRRPRP